MTPIAESLWFAHSLLHSGEPGVSTAMASGLRPCGQKNARADAPRAIRLPIL